MKKVAGLVHNSNNYTSAFSLTQPSYSAVLWKWFMHTSHLSHRLLKDTYLNLIKSCNYSSGTFLSETGIFTASTPLKDFNRVWCHYLDLC